MRGSAIHVLLVIWLQEYALSDWLFSCDGQALLARCPRFNLTVDILMDIYVMVNLQLSKCVTWLYRGLK